MFCIVWIEYVRLIIILCLDRTSLSSIISRSLLITCLLDVVQTLMLLVWFRFTNLGKSCRPIFLPSKRVGARSWLIRFAVLQGSSIFISVWWSGLGLFFHISMRQKLLLALELQLLVWLGWHYFTLLTFVSFVQQILDFNGKARFDLCSLQHVQIIWIGWHFGEWLFKFFVQDHV